MTLITTTQALAHFAETLKGAAFITVDTEFLRERTYWPKLCLLQVGGPTHAAAIDPLAPGIDLGPILDVIYDPHILKVVHAGRQDVEIFIQMTGRIPTPLFDTQIAAQVCGMGESASYEQLAGKYAHAKIDKSSRFTDWSRRPLTDKQITYALADVTHLRVVYEKMLAELERRDRKDWIAEEMAALQNDKAYLINPEEVWQKFRTNSSKPQYLHMLKVLAAWRERLAQHADVPRGRIMRDETLMEIAHHAPTSTEELGKMRGLSNGFAESDKGRQLVHIIKDALADPVDETLAEKPKRRTNGTQAALELLRVLLKHVAEDHDVAPRLICSSDELEEFASGQHTVPPIPLPFLAGWRYKIFGEQAERLMRGELSLRLNKGRVVIG